eukprot:CAMPEP_0174253378 /NCGR_PEP_ID=MMETSP0439-20130205/2743_1 /TAXON_ID=0 /ORGANISM="Stereomyxa ramosa, Strain Chinc5" /LENGTH=111 /DNA_ID=CAMNT_0015334375 /DNA_START=777 /DNA_END=1112 /DNA_ORIENTATION=+
MKYRTDVFASSDEEITIDTLETLETLKTEIISRVFDIIVSAPMHLVYLIQNNSMDLSTVLYLVLGEADRLLSMGFKEQVTTIMDACNNDNTHKSCGVLLDSEIEKLALGTH